MADLTALQLAVLDPTGTRQKLISRANKDALRPGDIVQVRRKNGLQPFSGVLMNIRRRGVDSGILLRNTLTRVGVEMWFKLYSPTIEGIDIVQRKEKRSARAKLYYMRYVGTDGLRGRGADNGVDSRSTILGRCRTLWRRIQDVVRCCVERRGGRIWVEREEERRDGKCEAKGGVGIVYYREAPGYPTTGWSGHDGLGMGLVVIVIVLTPAARER